MPEKPNETTGTAPNRRHRAPVGERAASALLDAPVREYGVRHRWPDDLAYRITPCVDLTAAEDELDELVIQGVTDTEIVTRVVPAWEISRDGLPATLRALAEARADGDVDDSTVRARLAALLPDHDGHAVTRAWRSLLTAIRAHRDAEDGPVDWNQVPEHLRSRDALARVRDCEVDAAVRRVIGSTS